MRKLALTHMLTRANCLVAWYCAWSAPGLSAELGWESEKLNLRVLVSVRLKNKGQECSKAKREVALHSSLAWSIDGGRAGWETRSSNKTWASRNVRHKWMFMAACCWSLGYKLEFWWLFVEMRSLDEWKQICHDHRKQRRSRHAEFSLWI